MEYQATIRHNGVNYTGAIAGSDAAAVDAALRLLPTACPGDAALIVEQVYRDARHISYVTTWNKYLIATE